MASNQPRDSKGHFKKVKHPKVYKVGRKTPVQRVHQTGKSDKTRDKKLSALAPGKRISKDGNVYYEYRKNRSDRRGSRL
jgi:hypothetical protein